MATITGSEVLAKALQTQGVDTMFYLMGGPMLETEAACIQLGIRAIDHRHEQAASFAAHAYTRVMRRPGVCMGGSGPGATNLLTGVATAFTDCAPLVAIGGSSPRVYLGMEAFQEIDQLAVFKPVTKWAERIYDAKRIPDVVATAFRQATSGRPGPVYIDMPGDVLGEKIEEESVRYAPAWKPSPRSLGDTGAVKEAIALLAQAERPLVIAGSGVWWSDGAAALQAFVEATGIPFYTKPISRGLIPEDHALSFLNARSTAFTEADVVAGRRHALRLDDPVRAAAAVRRRSQGHPRGRQPGRARPQPRGRRADRRRRPRGAPAAHRRGRGASSIPSATRAGPASCA